MEIEKRDGIRLHGIAPIVFFLFLFHKMDAMGNGTRQTDACRHIGCFCCLYQSGVFNVQEKAPQQSQPEALLQKGSQER